MIASIPSPGQSTINLGPLRFTAYGLMIAFGVLAGVELSRRRWVARGGSAEDISAIAVVAVPAGMIGARLYHVLTDWRRFEGRWGDAFKIWEGGLGIPGGMALGILVGVLFARTRTDRLRHILDACVPGLPLAQAIGRLGNWWNQEVFGRPTDLPWGLEIDEIHRPAEYLNEPTFHPTFLYEGLWNLGLMAVLLLVDRARIFKRGRLLAVYALGYGLGRLWIEALRSDEATILFGQRVNIWMSLALIAVGAGFLLINGRRTDDTVGLDAEDDLDPADDDPDEDLDPTDEESDESADEADVEADEDVELDEEPDESAAEDDADDAPKKRRKAATPAADD